jgi:hypothetical protein
MNLFAGDETSGGRCLTPAVCLSQRTRGVDEWLSGCLYSLLSLSAKESNQRKLVAVFVQRPAINSIPKADKLVHSLAGMKFEHDARRESLEEDSRCISRKSSLRGRDFRGAALWGETSGRWTWDERVPGSDRDLFQIFKTGYSILLPLLPNLETCTKPVPILLLLFSVIMGLSFTNSICHLY